MKIKEGKSLDTIGINSVEEFFDIVDGWDNANMLGYSDEDMSVAGFVQENSESDDYNVSENLINIVKLNDKYVIWYEFNHWDFDDEETTVLYENIRVFDDYDSAMEAADKVPKLIRFEDILYTALSEYDENIKLKNIRDGYSLGMAEFDIYCGWHLLIKGYELSYNGIEKLIEDIDKKMKAENETV